MIEVLKQALEALEYYQRRNIQWEDTDEQAITSLRQTIAELESQEPVALTDDEIYDAAFSAYCRGENTRELFRIMWGSRLTCSIGWDRDELKAFARNIAALYTHPPQRTWVDLTRTQIQDVYFAVLEEHRGGHQMEGQLAFGEALQAKLKERNT